MTYDRGALRAELSRDEGLRLKVYRCTANKLSIGIGRNLDDVGIRAHEVTRLGIDVRSCIKNGITREQAMVLLDSDIDECERQLDRNLPWWRQLGDVRMRVLLNMCFNLGINGLLSFRNTLAAIRDGRFAEAARGMEQSLWHRQVGVRAIRLEAMMRTGKVS